MQFFRPPASRPPVDAYLVHLIETDLADHLQAGTRSRAAGHAIVAGVVVVLLSRHLQTSALWGWYVGLLLLVGGAAAWLHRVHRAPAKAADAAHRLRSFVRVEGALGLAWSMFVLVVLPDYDLPYRALAFIFVTVWMSALQQSLSAHLQALYAAWLPVFAALLGLTLSRPGPYAPLTVTGLVVWFFVSLKFCHQLHHALVDSLHLRHRADALTAALRIEKEQAWALSRSRSRFLAAASHDLRQPVHALTLFVAALRLQPPAEQTLQLLGHVGDTVQSMERMFNGLLEMSRLDAGMIRPVRRPVDLQRLLAAAVAEETALAAARGLSLSFAADAGPAFAVDSDPLLLERIVRNLLSNAVRYTQKGGIRLQVRRRPGGVHIRVADSGIGIAPEHQQSIYQEFFQLHAHGGERTEGLGLGLAIVRRLCDLLGHRLTLRSRVGRGSIFTLRLPLAPGLPEPEQPVPDAADETRALPGAAGVVIVVDERAVTRLALRTLISSWGHRVLAVGGLSDLPGTFSGLDAPPCAIVCDGGPAASAHGMATLQRLRMEFNEDIPAVLLVEPAADSVQTTPPLPDMAVVAKPVNEQTLRAALRAVLQPQA